MPFSVYICMFRANKKCCHLCIKYIFMYVPKTKLYFMRLKEILDQPKTGQPLRKVVYRGDDKKFKTFDSSFIGKSTMANTEGFWFSSSKDAAGYYGQHVRPFEISMRNPLVMNDEDFLKGYPKGPPSFAKMAKEQGYDGIVLLNIYDGDMLSDVYCVWNPTQISRTKI